MNEKRIYISSRKRIAARVYKFGDLPSVGELEPKAIRVRSHDIGHLGPTRVFISES